MADIVTLRQNGAADYARLKAQCEGEVLRWEWYNAPCFTLQPLYFERTGRPPGKLLPSPPVVLTRGHQYGFDAGGQVVVYREWQSSTHYYETFYYGTADGREAICYNLSDGAAMSAERVVCENGLPVRYERAYGTDRLLEEYTGADGRIQQGIKRLFFGRTGRWEEYPLLFGYDGEGNFRWPQAVSRRLSEQLAAAEDEYRQLREQCEAQVVRWEWYSRQAFALQLYYFERDSQEVKGRPLSGTPKMKSDLVQYGFDSAGRIIIAHEYQCPPDYVESYYLWNENETVGIHYNAVPMVERLVRESDGLPIRYERMTCRSQVTDAYHYHAGQLGTIHSWLWNYGQEPIRSDYDLHHDEAGVLQTIRYRPSGMDGSGMICYANLPEGVTAGVLSEAIIRRLLERIPEAISAANIREPACSVLLAYDGETYEMLPPLLAVGIEAQRRAWGKQAREYLWNPAEFPRYYEDGSLNLADEALDRDCLLLNLLMSQRGSSAAGVKLLNDVARQLNQRSWDGILNVTDDFVVCAVDFEGADLKKNLRAAVPEIKLELLKQRQWIR